MNRTLRTTTIVGVIAATAVGALAAGPAFADSTATPNATPTSTATAAPTHTPRTLASVQAAAVTETGKRITALNTAISKVTANTTLTSSDKTTILGTLNGDLSGMKTVATKIAADTTLAQATTDYTTIFTTYRVYAVALPQAAYAATADTITSTTAGKLAAAETRLSGLLSGKDSAKSTPALQGDLTDMTTQIGKATSAVSGLAAGALAVTPAQYNTNHAIMAPFKASATTARAALKQALSDAKTVRTALK